MIFQDCNSQIFDFTHFNTSEEEHMRFISIGVIKEREKHFFYSELKIHKLLNMGTTKTILELVTVKVICPGKLQGPCESHIVSRVGYKAMFRSAGKIRTQKFNLQ